MSDSNGSCSVFIDSVKGAMHNKNQIDFKPKRILIMCTDTSIIAGDLISEYVNECSKVPCYSTSDTRIPGWVDKDTLVIVISDDIDKNGKLIRNLQKSGGKIILISHCANSKSSKIIEIKISNNETLSCLGEITGDIINILKSSKVLSKKDIDTFVHNDIKIKSDLIKKLKKDTIIFYLSNLKPAAGLWKLILSDITEKTVFFTEYPEFNHNEIVGWCMTPSQCKHSTFIFLCDNDTIPLLSTIKETMIEVINEYKVDHIEIGIDGKNNFEKNLNAIIMAEMLSKGDSQ